MQPYHYIVLESIIVIVTFVLIRFLINKVIDKTTRKQFIQRSRALIIRKTIHIVLAFICSVLLLVVLGVNQSDLAIFVGSVLTVIGVALFAQWSILSNLTSGIIIFFNHPVRLNDPVTIMEGKDYEIKGTVTNIGIFFITIKTSDSEDITLPNNIFIQKMIKKKNGS